jgi:hypothetical protein
MDLLSLAAVCFPARRLMTLPKTKAEIALAQVFCANHATNAKLWKLMLVAKEIALGKAPDAMVKGNSLLTRSSHW